MAGRKVKISVALVLLCALAYPYLNMNNVDEAPNKVVDALIALNEDGAIAVTDLFDTSDVKTICLGSAIPSLDRGASSLSGCHAVGDVLTMNYDSAGSCQTFNLDKLGYRILTGSEGETECVTPSSKTKLRVINRYDQIHLILEE